MQRPMSIAHPHQCLASTMASLFCQSAPSISLLFPPDAPDGLRCVVRRVLQTNLMPPRVREPVCLVGMEALFGRDYVRPFTVRAISPLCHLLAIDFNEVANAFSKVHPLAGRLGQLAVAALFSAPAS